MTADVTQAYARPTHTVALQEQTASSKGGVSIR